MQSIKEKLGAFWLGILLIFIISAIAYLPLVKGLGYLNDDWYLMYDMQVKDPSFFHEIFSIDRPARAWLMIPLFNLFGFNPLSYHISAYLFRALGGVFLYWVLYMLWKERLFFNFSSALLFTIYPGFLSQPNAIDYQSHIFGLFLALVSISLTIKSLLTFEKLPRVFYSVASILTGWGYLGQMEYFIGIEAFRFSVIFVLIWREKDCSFWQKIKQGFNASLPFLLVALGFLMWRLFFFESERKATDISLQISQLFSSPLTSLWWLNYLIQDMFTVILVAWGLPIYSLAFPMRLRDMIFAIGWSGLAILFVWWGLGWFRKNYLETETTSMLRMRREVLWVALVSSVGGLLPIILANRHVTLPDYSRYTLIASVGAILLLAIVLESIASINMKSILFMFFVAISILTHYSNAMKFVNETIATRNFWWQVTWRVPQFAENTTLIVSYPNGALSEDYFIWGPANFIFHPEKQNTNPVEVKLPAAVLTNDVVLQITSTGGTETPVRRGNYLERDFDNVLVMIQTSQNGCVRLINGKSPELSPNDQHRLFLVAPYSKLENIITKGDFQIPSNIVFGEEPEHDWCYYYQKADLARQRGDWLDIPDLLKTSLNQGYYPEDNLEWIPFLQASVVLGDENEVKRMVRLVAIDKFIRIEACEIMKDFVERELVTENIKNIVLKNLCK